MTVTTTEPTRTGRAWRATRSAPWAILVRNIVGQRVTSVPMTVRPTQPNRLRVMCAITNRPCHGATGSRASVAPSPAPIGRASEAQT